MLRQHMLAGRFCARVFTSMDKQLLTTLVLNNEYYQWAERLRDKRDFLESKGFDNPHPKDVGLTPRQLAAWYFGEQGRQVPAELAGHAQAVGFRDEETFLQAVLKEYIYRRVR
jgi:hypothetical protein